MTASRPITAAVRFLALNGSRAILVLTLALICLPSGGTAQTRIFSGEHADFSRLALVFPQETDWRAVPVDGGYRITFSPDPGRIDLSRVFELIPRDRIEGVRQDADGSLYISSTCDCHLDAFDAGRQTLAVDIKNGPDPSTPPSETMADGPVPPPAPAAGGAPLPAQLTIRTTARPPAAPAMPTVAASPPRFLGPRRAEPEAVTAPEDTAARQADTEEAGIEAPARSGTSPLDRTIAAADLEARLQDDMRRAADAGLVDLAEDLPSAPPRARDGAPPAPAPVASEVASQPEDASRAATASMGPERNIDLRTAFERRPPEDSAAEGLLPCPPATRFAFLERRSSADVLADLPRLRASVVDEAGTLDPIATGRLVEAYLALGFGAEARSLAAESGLPPQVTALYQSLAEIIDSGGDGASTVWTGLQRCPSPAALWAFLGHQPAAGAPPTDTAALQRAFFALPSHLRQQIGPGLVDRLRWKGITAAAASIAANLDVLEKGTEEAASGGDGPSAVSGPRITASGTEQRVDALLDRTETRMRARRLPAAQDLALAETLRREFAGTERGAKLADLVALRRLAAGGIDEAANRLLLPTSPADPDWARARASAVSSTIVAMDDATLLELALSRPGPELLALLPRAEIVATADRLTDLGFPDAALAALDRLEVTRGSPGERARARATLAAGDPARALALVAGQDSADAARLRGDALSALDSHALAAAAYDAAGAPERAARAAWISGDPATIARFGTDAQKRLAESLLEGTPPPPVQTDGTTATGSPSLSGARALAERSSALRTSLRQLLDSDPGDGEPAP